MDQLFPQTRNTITTTTTTFGSLSTTTTTTALGIVSRIHHTRASKVLDTYETICLLWPTLCLAIGNNGSFWPRTNFTVEKTDSRGKGLGFQTVPILHLTKNFLHSEASLTIGCPYISVEMTERHRWLYRFSLLIKGLVPRTAETTYHFCLIAM